MPRAFKPRLKILIAAFQSLCVKNPHTSQTNVLSFNLRSSLIVPQLLQLFEVYCGGILVNNLPLCIALYSNVGGSMVVAI